MHGGLQLLQLVVAVLLKAKGRLGLIMVSIYERDVRCEQLELGE